MSQMILVSFCNNSSPSPWIVLSSKICYFFIFLFFSFFACTHGYLHPVNISEREYAWLRNTVIITKRPLSDYRICLHHEPSSVARSTRAFHSFCTLSGCAQVARSVIAHFIFSTNRPLCLQTNCSTNTPTQENLNTLYKL